MLINAAVLSGHRDPFVLQCLELAEPGPEELLVRIVACGMCHTDLLPRNEQAPVALPIILGHEGGGIVEAIGSGVVGIAVGDHVVLTFDSCGRCHQCRAGHPAYCDTFLARNLFGYRLDGSTPVTDPNGVPVAARWFGQSAFASHAIATPRNAVVVDPALPLEVLAPLGCGMQTGAGSVLVALGARPGASIAVFGAGAVGLAAVMAARAIGVSDIVAVELHPKRRDLAAELGATLVVDGQSETVLAEIMDATGGLEYALDTTGVPSVIAIAVGCLKAGGICGLVGVQSGDLVLDPTALITGRTVMGILEGDVVPHTFIPQLVKLWQSGRFPFERLVEHFALGAINEAEVASTSGAVVKPVLLP